MSYMNGKTRKRTMPRRKQSDSMISFRLPLAQHRQLAKLATKRGITLTRLLLSCLDQPKEDNSR